MTLKEVLDRTTLFFKEKKFDSPRLDAELLLVKALNLSRRIDLYLKFDKPLSEEELKIARDFVRRRSLGEPVAYILGIKGFYNLDFKVTPDVLIPRPETEILVERAIAWALQNKLTTEKIRILDLGSGSGCIGISAAKELSLKGFTEVSVTFVDISSAALAITKENCQINSLERVEYICADVKDLVFSELEFDLILSNPPYIANSDLQIEENVKKYEPKQALYSGPEGTELLQLWSKKSVGSLKNPGFIGFEMGKDQGQQMKNYFAQLDGISHTELIKDLSHFDRHIVGTKSGI